MLRKELREQGSNRPILERKTLAMIFEHPSLRTRVSFETAMTQLGGHAINLQPTEIGLNTREPAGDVARVLGGIVDGIMARLRDQSTLDDLAVGASVPVINGLTNHAHPCQALADLLTLRDAFGDVAGRRVCYLGDANNVFRSLAVACGLTGIEIVCCSPDTFGPSADEVERLKRQVGGMTLDVIPRPSDAVAGCDALYTDVWASMGQELEATDRLKAFDGYAIKGDLLRLANDGAIVLHCLPAHRGQEIDAKVLESPQSRVFEQAHNRLHAQKGLLAVLLEEAHG